MTRCPPAYHLVLLGGLYVGTAMAAVSLTRYDGGVAFIWIATAILIGYLASTPRACWRSAILVCAVPGIVVTGFAGLGWSAAVPLAVANVGEAALAAGLMRRQRPGAPIESLGWLASFVAVVGVIAPLASGMIGASTTWLVTGKPFVSNLLHWYTGHALGNLAFAPIAMLVGSGEAARWFRATGHSRRAEAGGLIALVAGISLVVFVQRTLPLLFLPMLPVILATFRSGRVAAASSITLVAVIGGIATLLDHGPVSMIGGPPGLAMQFFQFYLAATVLTVLPVTADLSRRKLLFRQLRDSEARYRALADHSTDIIMNLNADGRIRFASPSARTLGGYAPDALLGTTALALVAPEFRDAVAAAHRAALAANGEPVRVEYQAITADGTRRWFETHTRAVMDETGQPDGVISAIRDIDARKALEAQLSAAALTDPLTGLANRRAFTDALDRCLAGGRHGCVALFDIDHFKRVNDTHGHAVGDEVLRGFARVAAEVVREGDTLARIGGEEFGVLLADASPAQAHQVCERLRQAVAAALFRTPTATVRVTVSGGVAPIDGGGATAILAAADAALYQAKRSGRDRLTLAA